MAPKGGWGRGGKKDKPTAPSNITMVLEPGTIDIEGSMARNHVLQIGTGGGGGSGPGWPPTDADFYDERTFETIANGGDADADSSGFDWCYGLETVTTNVYHTGTRCARVPINSTNFPNFGGYMRSTAEGGPRPKLYAGDEMWLRFWCRFTSAFQWNPTGGRGAKFVRLKPYYAAGGSTNWLEAYSNSSQVSWHNSISYNLSSYPDRMWDDYGGYAISTPKIGASSYGLAHDNWECLEIYLSPHHLDGYGMWKVWRNGTVVFANTRKTLLESGGYIGSFGWPLYYGEDSPATLGFGDELVCWFDDYKCVVNGDPGARDAQGNPFIGLD